jgi:hypothetical protein
VNSSWIVLDGEMSPEQCATFVILMEDGVDFQQGNGELVAISPDQSFLCECDSLEWTTPGLLSKAGLIHVAPTEASANAVHFLTAWTEKYSGYGEVMQQSLLSDATRYCRAPIFICSRKRGGRVELRPYCMCINSHSLFLEFFRYVRVICRKDPSSIPTVLPDGFSIVGIAQTAAALFDSLFEDSVRDVRFDDLLLLVKLWMNYAMLWAYGGMISTDVEFAPQREVFSRWWHENTGVEFGSQGLVWDYVVETTKVRSIARSVSFARTLCFLCLLLSSG